jgi:hypothetical protein
VLCWHVSTSYTCSSCAWITSPYSTLLIVYEFYICHFPPPTLKVHELRGSIHFPLPLRTSANVIWLSSPEWVFLVLITVSFMCFDLSIGLRCAPGRHVFLSSFGPSHSDLLYHQIFSPSTWYWYLPIHADCLVLLGSGGCRRHCSSIS